MFSVNLSYWTSSRNPSVWSVYGVVLHGVFLDFRMRGAPGQEQQAAAELGGAQMARGMWAGGSNKRSHASHSVRYLELRGSCQGGRSRRAKIGGLGGKWCWMVRDRIGWSSVKLRDAKLKLPRTTAGHTERMSAGGSVESGTVDGRAVSCFASFMYDAEVTAGLIMRVWCRHAVPRDAGVMSWHGPPKS